MSHHDDSEREPYDLLWDVLAIALVTLLGGLLLACFVVIAGGWG